jgi:AGZA family xanthine/uracil permease-like MFS transporter
MDKLFHLKENGTTVRTEVIAGITTFMTMAYIIALNPNLLTAFGAYGKDLWNAVFLATCIASAIGSLCMALFANKPFVMAPGMGVNTFFALVSANVAMITGMTYLQSFRCTLAIILIEGVIFIILSLINVREKIYKAIPAGVRIGIAPSIGFMLMNIGFGSNAGVFVSNEDGSSSEFHVMRDFFGINPFESLRTASFVPPFKDLADTTLFKLDFKGLFNIGWLTVITLVITFCIIDLFDTMGTLVGTCTSAKMIDKDGNIPGMKEMLLSDAVGTVTGSLTGTSTVTTFVESVSGVEAGGRTGLTAAVAAVLFLLCIFAAPLAAIIPPAATSPALIYVGILMLGNLKNIDFTDISQILPVGVMLLAMPVSGSVGHAIGLALICYTFIKVLMGKFREVSVPTYILSAVFILKFFLAF